MGTARHTTAPMCRTARDALKTKVTLQCCKAQPFVKYRFQMEVRTQFWFENVQYGKADTAASHLHCGRAPELCSHLCDSLQRLDTDRERWPRSQLTHSHFRTPTFMHKCLFFYLRVRHKQLPLDADSCIPRWLFVSFTNTRGTVEVHEDRSACGGCAAGSRVHRA